MALRQATPEEKEIAAQMEAALATETVAEEVPGPGPAPLELNPDDLEPVKRKPGRPVGGGAKKTEELLHQTIETGEVPAKRGRKPTAKETKSHIDPGKLGNQLVGIHQLAAMFTNTPELQLTDAGGRALGEAIVNVCNEYDLNISGKTGAMMQLLATSAMIYAPMFMAIRFRYAQEELARAQANPTPYDQTHYNASGYPNPVPEN
jgi:hypothetical protein